MRIGLFIPVSSSLFPRSWHRYPELLERFGQEVAYRRDQTCCEQPMAKSGFNAECADIEPLLVRNFGGFNYAVAPSGAAFITFATTWTRTSRRPR
jgi:L-lactate dehydrogenase complex protein LldE